MGSASAETARAGRRPTTLGARVRDLRLALDLTMADLALPDLSVSHLSLIESGRRHPSQAVLGVLARKLCCSVTYLVGGVAAEDEAELRAVVASSQLCLDHGDADEALVGFGRALASSSLTAFAPLARQVRLGYALALEATGDLAAAVATLREHARELHLTDDPARWARVHLVLCRCQRDAGQLDAAVRTGEYALGALTGVMGWSADAVQLGATLTAAYVYRGDLATAGMLARRLTSRAQVIGSPAAMMAAIWNSALVAEANGDKPLALELHWRALVLLGEDDDPRNLARVRVAYGGALLEAHPDQPQQAFEVLVQGAAELAETAAGPVDLAWCEMDQARVLMVMGRAQDALPLARNAVDLLATSKGLVAAKAHVVLAGACLASGDTTAAAASTSHAASELEPLGAGRMAAQPWRDVADLARALGQTNLEVAALRHALGCAGL